MIYLKDIFPCVQSKCVTLRMCFLQNSESMLMTHQSVNVGQCDNVETGKPIIQFSKFTKHILLHAWKYIQFESLLVQSTGW